MSATHSTVPGAAPRPTSGRTRQRPIAAAAAIGLLAAASACKDTAVPFFDAPTSIPNSQIGVQNAVTGLFSATRVDASWYIYYAGSFSRDIFWFLGASANVLTDVGGLKPITNSGIQAILVWDNEYAQAKQANNIIGIVGKVPTYTPAQASAIVGMVQTIKALNFMMVAETRDTLGIPLYSIGSNPTDPPYCNKDVWRYIVALLDSGLTNLNAAGPTPLPVRVPPGFASVGQTAAPSTAPGSFAAFNRALAGKANLELAYAIARSTPAAHPDPIHPGAPDPTALQRADSALLASALYNPGAITPPVAGNFPLDQFGVYHTFSGQSGDLQNPIVAFYFLYDALYDLAFDVDTLNDLRWKNKFVRDPHNVQLSQYAGTSDPYNFLPYATVGSPIPIVRAEELALVRAQVRLGLGDLAGATALINQVHEQAGGFTTPLTIPQTYTAVRDSLLKEQRISTVFEASGDRMIALRMYGLEAVADTTWQAKSGPDGIVDAALGQTVDYHTTVASVPLQELSARGGAWTLVCP